MTAAAFRATTIAHGPQLPPDHLILGRSGSENFPVASRLLPPDLRSDLIALYGWARLVDELGDNYAGDRLAALDLVEEQLLWALGEREQQREQQPSWAPFGLHPLVGTMAEAVRRRSLPVQPLLDLVQANRQDQAISRYETFEDLVGYCRLSANPVGQTVLAIFAKATPDRLGWSDSICTALQLVEHWQDVAEDAIVGRVYLPQEDMRRFGVTDDELLPPTAGYVNRRKRGAPGGAKASSRSMMAFEAARARTMLEEGAPLVDSLDGRLRFAVAGFVAGGRAALDAIAAVDFDIYADTPRPKASRFLNHLWRLVGPRWATPVTRARYGIERAEQRSTEESSA